MQKPGFSVVSFATCFLAVAGLAISALRKHLPEQPANALARESDEFLVQGGNQQIAWRKFSDDVLAESRRLDRPILLVLGTVWSREARQADRHVFTDQDVQSFLARNFVCARIDLDAHPEWMSSFLPLSRALTSISIAFQVIYLDSSGEPYDYLGSRGRPLLTDPNALLDEFISARRQYEKKSGAHELQGRDRALLTATEARLPSVEQFHQDLRQRASSRYGGFPLPGQAPRPWAFRFLYRMGDLETARAALDPMLRSGWVDWLDGGFFRRSRRADWTDLEFDKIAVGTSENMVAIAQYAVLTNDDFAGRIAKNAFDSLISEFSDSGFVATARLGDEDRMGRSAKASFKARDLRTTWGSGWLTSEEIAAARELFDLRVEINPQMTLRVSQPTKIADMRFEPLLTKLREQKDQVEARFTSRAYANVCGAVSADLYMCVRLWDDAARLSAANASFEALGVFGSGQDLSHSPTQSLEERPFLGDYLTAAEACLNRYLCTGEVAVFRRGERILGRAKELFATERGWLPTLPSQMSSMENALLPEVLDNGSEALTAKAIRMTSAYGRLLRGATTPVFYEDEALDLVSRYGLICPEMGLPAAGYMHASMAILDDAHCITVGPGATAMASAIFRRVPTRLAAPALGPVRVDLQKREPGAYVVSGPNVTGPFSVDEAVQALGWVHSAATAVP